MGYPECAYFTMKLQLPVTSKLMLKSTGMNLVATNKILCLIYNLFHTTNDCFGHRFS